MRIIKRNENEKLKSREIKKENVKEDKNEKFEKVRKYKKE